MTSIQFHLFRLINLQHYCWTTGKKKWARELGQAIKAIRADHPELQT